MLEADLIKLIHKIQHNQCDFQTIEVIAANTNTPRLYETLFLPSHTISAVLYMRFIELFLFKEDFLELLKVIIF